MGKRIIWAGRSSPILFLYEYLGVLLLAYLAHRFIGGPMLIYATPGFVYFILKARSMQYVVSDVDVHFSRSLGDDEEMTVPLGDIQGMQVVDRQPWSLMGLGTIILLTNPDEDMQPCIKCVPSPHDMAKDIRRAAQALGAPRFPIEIV
jgi:hypothetical protein